MNPSVKYIGIDFGTSSSKMAWYNPQTKQAEIIKNDKGDEQTPSVVYLHEDILVGKEAVDILNDHEERKYVITSIKRDLEDISSDINVPGKSWPKEQVVAKILAKLKQDAEQLQFHQEVTHAVITYPASFSAVEEEVLRRAAELAGFSKVEFLYEPVAAALAYVHMHDAQVGKYILVYDLGAGTFDLAILRREEDGTFILAMSPTGIKHCAGNDFDWALYTYFDKIAVEKLGRHISLTEEEDSPRRKGDLRFLQLCRQRKEDISFTGRPYMIQHILEPHQEVFSTKIDQATFEVLITDMVKETLQRTQDYLHEASKKDIVIDTLLLVGGSTRIPLVQKMLNDNFADPKPVFWQQSSTAVALGAAYYGNNLWRPETQYRNALKAAKAAYAKQRLEEAQVIQLADLARQLDLTPTEQITLEYEVLDSTKEGLLEKQNLQDQYRAAVKDAWADRHLDRTNIAMLETLAKNLRLNTVERANIEDEVMGKTKEQVLSQQKAPVKYLTTLMALWVDEALRLEEQTYLFKLRRELNLDKRQYTPIEESVMGATLETIRDHQSAMEKYRHEVISFWDQRDFSRKRMLQLYQLADQLNLDDDKIDKVECEVMRSIKEAVFAHEYQAGHYKALSSRAIDDQQEIFHFIGNLQVDNDEIATLTFSNDRNLLACCSKNAKVYVWHLDKDNDDILIQQDWKTVLSLIIAYDKAHNLQDSKIHAAELLKEWYEQAHSGPYTLDIEQQPHVITFSPSASLLATADEDGTIKVWNWHDSEVLATFRHKGGVHVLAFSPNGELLASGGDDTLIRLWEWRRKREKPGSPLKSHSQGITSIAFSLDTKSLISGSKNGGIRLWNLDEKQPLKPEHKHTDTINAISFSPDGNLFATASLDHHIHLWTLTGKHVQELTGHTDGIKTVTFSPDGLLASGSIRKELIRLWKPDTAKFLQSLTGHTGKISAIAFSPDGEVLIASGDSRTINVYQRFHQ